MKSQTFTGFKGLNHHISMDSMNAEACTDVRFNGEYGGITNFGGFDTQDYDVAAGKYHGFYHIGTSQMVHMRVTASTTTVVENFGTAYNVYLFSGEGTVIQLLLSEDAMIKSYGDKFYIIDDGDYYRVEYLDGKEYMGNSYTGWYAFKNITKDALADPIVSKYYTGRDHQVKVLGCDLGFIVKTPSSLELRNSDFRIQKVFTNVGEEEITSVTTDGSQFVWATLGASQLVKLSLSNLEIIDSVSVGSGTEVIRDMQYTPVNDKLWIVTDSYLYQTTALTITATWSIKIQHSTSGFYGVTSDNLGHAYVISDADGTIRVYTQGMTNSRSWSLSDSSGIGGITYDFTNLYVIYTYYDDVTNTKVVRTSITGTLETTLLSETGDLQLQQPNMYNDILYSYSLELGMLLSTDDLGTTWETTNYGISVSIGFTAPPAHGDTGTWFYMLGFVLQDGQELMVVKTNGMTLDSVTQYFNMKIFLKETDVPSLFGLVEKIKIYRGYNVSTNFPSAPITDYYLAGEVDIATATTYTLGTLNDMKYVQFIDDVSEALLSDISYSDDNNLTRVDDVKIPSPTAFEAYGERMFLGGLVLDGDSYRDWVIWTPERSYDTIYWLEDNQTRLDIGAVSEVLGMFQFRGMLAIIADSKIAMMNGFNQSGVRDAMAVSKDGICVYDDNLYFVSSSSIFWFDGYNFRDIGKPIFHPKETQLTKANLSSSILTPSNELEALFFVCGVTEFVYYLETDDWSYLSYDITGKFSGQGIEYYVDNYRNVVTYTKDIGDYVTDPSWTSKKQTIGTMFHKKHLLLGSLGYKSDYALELTFTADGTDKKLILETQSEFVAGSFGIKTSGKILQFKFSHQYDGYKFDVNNLTLLFNLIGTTAKVDS